jgi:hypothetical protein
VAEKVILDYEMVDIWDIPQILNEDLEDNEENDDNEQLYNMRDFNRELNCLKRKIKKSLQSNGDFLEKKYIQKKIDKKTLDQDEDEQDKIYSDSSSMDASYSQE